MEQQSEHPEFLQDREQNWNYTSYKTRALRKIKAQHNENFLD